ncbi:MAG: HTTM domain-containing protein [Thermoanaerobaculia bacterium]
MEAVVQPSTSSYLSRHGDLRRFASTKHRLIGLSVLRICLGLLILDLHVRHLAQRQFLWGDQGVVPYPLFVHLMRWQRNRSLYLLSPSPALHTAIFFIGILVAIAFTIGYRTRIASILFYVFTWSLYGRNPFIMDGGDNLIYLVAFFMIFTDCGAYFSVDAVRRKRPHTPNPFAALLHNYALLAIIVQLCLLYFTSAFFKSQGHMWQDGTAIYYVLRAAEFNLSPMAHYFYDNDTVVTLLTWSTLVFQMAWPFLIWQKRARVFVAAGAILLHSMIGYFMGLVWFSAAMMSAELIIFDDDDYRRFGAWLQSVAARLRVLGSSLTRRTERTLGPEQA